MPVPPGLSIARLAEIWDRGVSKERFVEFAVDHLLSQGRERSYIVFNAGAMSLRGYLEDLDDRVHGRRDALEWGYRQIAEEILLGPADVAALETALGIPLPRRLAAWASAAVVLQRKRGRRSRHDEIVAEHSRFTPGERVSKHEYQAALIRERLGGGAGLSSTAIFRALGWRK